MGSHSVTGYPAELIFPPLLEQSELVLDLATPERCKAELTKLAWLHIEVVYPPEDGRPY